MRRWRLRYALFRNIFHAPQRCARVLWEFANGATTRRASCPRSGAAGIRLPRPAGASPGPDADRVGRDDRVIPRHDALEFERHLSDSRLVVFDRCGHVPMAERPVRFNRLLERFLSE